ncbi:unnamed protein product [Caenorhabditis auriculariae]|uniref:Inositol polyphosphate-related phosphatase domain-containing protein n=1 Tax=Caenorhabditis auriculariae TaxID=2777116 RepID=A0A8S1GQZ4_9PELO|nr:unnamed protein product [Caenorhabditis auriculariae]
MDWIVVLATFNVNMQPPSEEGVVQLLAGTPPDPHILVVGMQEVAHSETIGGAAETWQKHFVKWATKVGHLTLLTKNYQATNQISIFVRKRLVSYIKKIDFRFARNTLGGLTGHKGSIGVRIQLRNPFSLVFVNSHFIHDAAAYERRLAQYQSNRHCMFPEDSSVRATFWVGDLNFRVDHDTEEVLQMIQNGTHLSLLEKDDQLKKAQRDGEAFKKFKEQPINFRPTYRLFVGTTKHDGKRTPSWCDRILYKGEDIHPVTYNSNENVVSSDHFPMKSAPTADWDVIFEKLPTWYTSVPLIGRLQIKASYWKDRGSYRDWIGLYPATIDDCTTALHWMYVATCVQQTVDDTRYHVCEFVNLDVGKYRLGYFSAYSNCLVGLSKTFEVVEQPE